MKYLIFPFILFVVIISACNKNTEVPNEEELITTLRYTLKPVSGGSDVMILFKDLDGDGGNPPQITAGTLAKNTTYAATIELLNEQASPADNITEEIKEEDEDHQFFFGVSSSLSLTVEYDDEDANKKPVGLKTKVQTGNSSSGKLTITLRHLPNKSGSGVSSGSITNAGGDTDIEVEFTINVQ